MDAQQSQYFQKLLRKNLLEKALRELEPVLKEHPLENELIGLSGQLSDLKSKTTILSPEQTMDIRKSIANDLQDLIVRAEDISAIINDAPPIPRLQIERQHSTRSSKSIFYFIYLAMASGVAYALFFEDNLMDKMLQGFGSVAFGLGLIYSHIRIQMYDLMKDKVMRGASDSEIQRIRQIVRI